MGNYNSLIIHSCSTNVVEVEYVDITFSLAGCNNVISITATPHSDTDNPNVNVFVTDITKNSARLNFSSKYTGTVKYTVMGKR